MGKIHNHVIRDVINLVESQKEAFRASQSIYDDDSSASNNFSRVQINEMVEHVSFIFFISLIFLISSIFYITYFIFIDGSKEERQFCRVCSLFLFLYFFFTSPYADPVIIEMLQNKVDRIVALETKKTLQFLLKWRNKMLKWQNIKHKWWRLRG